MALALPHLVPDSRVQGNFDELARMLSDVGSDVLNVTDFGADPSGVADSAPALQAAVTQAGMLVGPAAQTTHISGPPVYAAAVMIPAGLYLIGSAVNVPNNIMVFGQGRSTLLRASTATNWIFSLRQGYRCRFTNFAMDAAVPQTAGGSFDMSATYGQVRFDNLTHGDNLHTFYYYTSGGNGESSWHHIRAFSQTEGQTIGVRNVSYGWRLGDGITELNGLYMSDFSVSSPTQTTTTNQAVTWPLSGGTVNVVAVSRAHPLSGSLWIGDQKCTFAAHTGPSPTSASATGSITGGTLAAGTYYYRVAAVLPSGTELAACQEFSATVASGTTGSVAVACNSVRRDGAYGNTYRVYRASASGGPYAYQTTPPVMGPVALAFTDTGAAGSAGTPIEPAFTGVTGGNAYNGTYATGARVKMSGPTWIEVNLADTLTLTNSLFESGEVGIETIGGSPTTATKVSNVSFVGQIRYAMNATQLRDGLFSNCSFAGAGSAERGPGIRLGGSVTGLSFSNSTFHAMYGNHPVRLRSGINEVQFVGCLFHDSGGRSGAGKWALGPFSTQISTGGITAADTTIIVDEIPPVGMTGRGLVAIGSELVTYTGVQTSPKALTGCTRGAFGTTAAAAGAGTAVTWRTSAIFVDRDILGYSIIGCTFGNSYGLGGVLDYGVVVEAGSGGAFEMVNNRFRSNLLSGSFLAAATGLNQVIRGNATSPESVTVASAATITLPTDKEFVTIGGNTNITSVVASWPGRTVTLLFTGTPTFTDGSNLKLAGNLVATADDTISLVCDGTNWYETARSVN